MLLPDAKLRPGYEPSIPIGQNPTKYEVTFAYMQTWNKRYFEPRGLKAVMCQEFEKEHPDVGNYCIYLVDTEGAALSGARFDALFGVQPDGVGRTVVLEALKPDVAFGE